MIDDEKSASHGDINGNIKRHKPCGKPFWDKDLPKLVDYRLVGPALVFKMAWLDKDYKTKDLSSTQCFKAAGFMLEALLSNVVHCRRLPCGGHVEWYCKACPRRVVSSLTAQQSRGLCIKTSP